MAASVENILLKINELDERISSSHEDKLLIKDLIKQRDELSRQLREANSMLDTTKKVLKG